MSKLGKAVKAGSCLHSRCVSSMFCFRHERVAHFLRHVLCILCSGCRPDRGKGTFLLAVLLLNRLCEQRLPTGLSACNFKASCYRFNATHHGVAYLRSTRPAFACAVPMVLQNFCRLRWPTLCRNAVHLPANLQPPCAGTRPLTRSSRGLRNMVGLRAWRRRRCQHCFHPAVPR